MRFNFLTLEGAAFASIAFGGLWSYSQGGGFADYPFLQALALVISIPFNFLFSLPGAAPWLLLPTGIFLLFYLDFLGDRLAPVLSMGVIGYLAIVLGA